MNRRFKISIQSNRILFSYSLTHHQNYIFKTMSSHHHKHFTLYNPPRLRKGMKGLSIGSHEEEESLEDKHVGWYDLFFDLCLVTGKSSSFHVSKCGDQNHFRSHSNIFFCFFSLSFIPGQSRWTYANDTKDVVFFFTFVHSWSISMNDTKDVLSRIDTHTITHSHCKTFGSRRRDVRWTRSRNDDFRILSRIESVRRQRQRPRLVGYFDMRMDCVQMLVIRELDADASRWWRWSRG